MTAVSLAGPAVRELLADWLPRQRWWPAKGRTVTLEPVGRLRLPPAGADVPAAEVPGADPVEVEVLFLATGTPPGQVVQVPLTSRPTAPPELAGALVGRLDDPFDGVRWIYDGSHDPAFVSAWVRLLANQREIRWNRVSARGVRRPDGADPVAGRRSQVLRGEQSNTSIILDPDGDDAIIVKLFRVLRPGENPDIAVSAALAAGGCDRVPRPVGWVEGSWPDPAGDTVLRGHLAYACEFLADSEDGWRTAGRAVTAGRSFASEAAGIGTATAQVHATLAAVLPTVPTTRARLRALSDQLSGRLRWAVSTTPKLTELQPAAESLFARVRRLPVDPAGTPVWQRIHGDLHLGQVLHSPSRGWVLIDFEGEPLTPVAERSRPELALRDVAGMLRSFDYAAQHATENLQPGDPSVAAAREWVRECRAEFLRAYRAVAHAHGAPSDEWEAVLLRAFEVDKALYEVVYETWNRPHWVARPLDALRRLLTEPLA